jgi:acyl-CoA reductase-like NAD-dependent aldehyde dehydrogenase
VRVPVTAELGNVSPVVIVPGRWSSSDLRYQAARVATMLATNAGFNCVATRVLVTAAAWPQRQAFLDALEHALAALPRRQAYYPRAAEIHAAFLERPPDARRLGGGGEGTLPWTLIRGVDPDDPDDPCFTTEAFCGLMAETALPGDSAGKFLDRAVRFCNDTLWATLCASLIVKQKRDPEITAAVTRPVRDLRYGAVCVNAWPALPYGLDVCSWAPTPATPTPTSSPGAAPSPTRLCSATQRGPSCTHRFATGHGRRGSPATRTPSKPPTDRLSPAAKSVPI